jgi:hypothetical protein
VLYRRSFGKSEIDGECRLLGDPHTAELSKEKKRGGGGENAFLYR